MLSLVAACLEISAFMGVHGRLYDDQEARILALSKALEERVAQWQTIWQNSECFAGFGSFVSAGAAGAFWTPCGATP